jgi:hypothetical protein
MLHMPSDTAKSTAKRTLSDKDISTYARRGGPAGGGAGTDVDSHTDVDAHAETDTHSKPATDSDTDTAKPAAAKTDRTAGS